MVNQNAYKVAPITIIQKGTVTGVYYNKVLAVDAHQKNKTSILVICKIMLL